MSDAFERPKIKLEKWDWLLLIGLSLAPMTGLRIWKIGPAELLCFIWGLKYLPRRYFVINNISRFFIGFLGTMFIGTMIGIIIAPDELVISDWFTWLFLAFISLSVYAGLSTNSIEYNERLLELFSGISVTWYLFLYFYSIYVSRFFLGAPLWYNGVRFTGGSQNPHQVAVLMCGITFCFFRNIVRKKNVIPSIGGIIAAVFVEIQTASSTGIASIFVGLLALIMVLTFYRMKSISARISILILELLLGATVIVVAYPILYRYFYSWLSSDANGIGRLDLFSQISISFRKSPIFGLGPGTHAMWRTYFKEYHNTYLEIIAATGIVGAAVFVSLTIKSVKKLLFEPTLLPIMVAIYGYGLAGFAMRRLAYWGIFIFIYVLAEQTEVETYKLKKLDQRVSNV